MYICMCRLTLFFDNITPISLFGRHARHLSRWYEISGWTPKTYGLQIASALLLIIGALDFFNN
jgi:hypothetical protein